MQLPSTSSYQLEDAFGGVQEFKRCRSIAEVTSHGILAVEEIGRRKMA